MTTENDELGANIKLLGEQAEKAGVLRRGSDDPTGEFPRADYWYESSINKATRGAKRNDLKLNGGVEGQDNIDTGLTSDPTRNNVNESQSGHVIEIDDTAGGERILIRHRTGAGIEMRSDGTIVINTTANRITVVQGDENVQIEGNANIQYNGNLNVEVTGDYNLDVGGNYNVFVAGDLKEGIDGSHRNTTRGPVASVAMGPRSETTKGSKVVTQLGGVTDVVKGERKNITEGEVICSSSGQFKISSEERTLMSSPDINIAATNLSVFGATGTMGGENMIMYTRNMYAGQTVYATSMQAETFHGDLNGASAVTRSQSYGENVTSGGSITNTAVDEEATAIPTSTLLNKYLDEGAYGAPKVKVDVDDKLLNSLDRTIGTGNVTNKPLTTGEVRSKLRDNGTLNNTEFTASQIAAGKLNPEYPTASPSSIGRVEGPNPSKQSHEVFIGPAGKSLVMAKSTFTPNPSNNLKYMPSSLYNPENAKVINAGLKLAKGVPLAKFLGGKGEKTNLNHLTAAERRQVARNLSPQAEAVRRINVNEGKFKDKRLIVVEGLYKQGAAEKLEADSLNQLATNGQVVVYQLLGLDGRPDIPGMFDMAVYWKDNIQYDQLILDYDKFDPTGKLEAHVIVVQPNMPVDFDTKYKKQIKTLFNGNVQSANSLVEIKS